MQDLEQICSFLLKNDIYEEFQSGFRPRHSTETALVKMTNDFPLASDQGCISLLVLLDLSAAFDTIDHDILIDRLQNYTGIQGQALSPPGFKLPGGHLGLDERKPSTAQPGKD